MAGAGVDRYRRHPYPCYTAVAGYTSRRGRLQVSALAQMGARRRGSMACMEEARVRPALRVPNARRTVDG